MKRLVILMTAIAMVLALPALANHMADDAFENVFDDNVNNSENDSFQALGDDDFRIGDFQNLREDRADRGLNRLGSTALIVSFDEMRVRTLSDRGLDRQTVGDFRDRTRLGLADTEVTADREFTGLTPTDGMVIDRFPFQGETFVILDIIRSDEVQSDVGLPDNGRQQIDDNRTTQNRQRLSDTNQTNRTEVQRQTVSDTTGTNGQQTTTSNGDLY